MLCWRDACCSRVFLDRQLGFPSGVHCLTGQAVRCLALWSTSAIHCGSDVVVFVVQRVGRESEFDNLLRSSAVLGASFPFRCSVSLDRQSCLLLRSNTLHSPANEQVGNNDVVNGKGSGAVCMRIPT